MNVSTRQTPRRRLETLWEKIAVKSDISVSEENEVTDEGLEKYQIQRVHYDFSELDNVDTSLALQPPILFLPIHPEVIEHHPIDSGGFGDEKERKKQMEFRDYEPPTDADELKEGFWTPLHCAMDVFNYLNYWSRRWPRIGLQQSLSMMHNMHKASRPNPIFRGGELVCYDLDRPFKRWRTQTILEHWKENGRSVHPHVNFMTVQYHNGKDGSMLFGELAPIITVMRNRALQPKVDEDGEEISPRQLEFEREERFPVIMISFLGPQHGRLLYACMDGGTLVIRQSRLYSFERWTEAPWDFFSRMFLSLPLEEDSGLLQDRSH